MCTSLLYKDWAGYYAVRSYDTYPDREYYAIRNAVALIDVTPLYKYEVHGPDAARFLSRVMVRDITKLKIGRVYYCCWCNGEGKMVDDGTVARLDDTYYRVTSSEPAYAWLQRFTAGSRVTVDDSTRRLGALSVQGPNSRALLVDIAGPDVEGLGYFQVVRTAINGVDVELSRTGYTGDLGYEVWVRAGDALKVWDVIAEAGTRYGALPVGLDAMDITRIEAGYILNGVDYYNATRCMIASRQSTPFELGLGWMVRLQRDPFNGRDALVCEKRSGPKRVLVGLVTDWDEYEELFARHGLPPELSTAAWRTPVPVYDEGGVQVGYANSGAWSPTLKRNLALATVKAPYGNPGTRVRFEVTVEYERKTVAATVVERPFLDPPRKRT